MTICFFLLSAVLSVADISGAIDWLCTHRYENEQKWIGVDWAEHPLLKRPELQQEIAAAVNKSSVEYQVDPLLILATMWPESRVTPSVASLTLRGSKGELGLMQILPDGACDRECDLSTVHGQVDCGTKCLKSALDGCHGNALHALGKYKYGGKCMETKAGSSRYKLYQRLKRVTDGRRYDSSPQGG